MELRVRERLFRSAIGLLLAVAYFLAPVFVVATLTLGVLFWTTVGYLFAFAIVVGTAVAVPLWVVASALARRTACVAIGAVLFLVVGAVAAGIGFGILALGATGHFAPLDALGARGENGVLVFTGYAAVCSMLGWLTVRLHATRPAYSDALGGHTFEELASLLELTSDN
ncbi:MAG TPA: hypothetical protein VGF80_15035 [Galbitalea sp.]|jgi:hypothetical protein